MRRGERGTARVIMLRSSTVPRRRGEGNGRGKGMKREGRRVLSTCSFQPPSPVSFLYESAPQRVPPRSLRPRCTPSEDKERDGEGTGTTKRRGQKGREGGEGGRGGQGRVRKTCPSLHDPVHSVPTVLIITKRNALS